jgi:hypothetical protein
MSMSMGTSYSQGLPTDRILGVIDASPETSGMGCYVIADGRVTKLRDAGSRQSSVVIELRPNPQQAAGRSPFCSPSGEWISWGLSCSGMALTWVGVVGTASAAPVTGGSSLAGTAFLWGDAMAATAQCSAASYRLSNVLTDNQAANTRLDHNQTYLWSMRGLDAVGLVGAGGAVKEIKATYTALEETDITLGEALGASNRHDRMLFGSTSTSLF